MGPSNVLMLPKVHWLFFLGYAINGFSQGLFLTPTLPEIMDSIYQKTGLIEGENDTIDGIIADKASGYYCSFYSLGVITAPILGSAIFEALNDNWYATCDIFAGLGLIYSLIYLFVNVLPDIKRDRLLKEIAENEVLASPIVQKKYGIIVTNMDETNSNEEGTSIVADTTDEGTVIGFGMI
jgi:MFS family permease